VRRLAPRHVRRDPLLSLRREGAAVLVLREGLVEVLRLRRGRRVVLRLDALRLEVGGAVLLLRLEGIVRGIVVVGVEAVRTLHCGHDGVKVTVTVIDDGYGRVEEGEASCRWFPVPCSRGGESGAEQAVAGVLLVRLNRTVAHSSGRTTASFGRP